MVKLQQLRKGIIFEKKTVLRYEKLQGDYFITGLELGSEADNMANIEPGQFYMLGMPARAESYDPLLNRPISIMDIQIVDGKNIAFFLIKKVGRGTSVLAKLDIGETLFIHGPLGNFFPEPKKKQKIALIGGGVGIAPLYFAAKKWQKNAQLAIFYGGRNSAELPLLDKFEHLLISGIYVSTEDGSAGYCGLVTELFAKKLKESNFGAIYSCGPMPMMRAVAQLAEKNNIPCWLSLENRMACGMGVCLGCAIPIKVGGGTRMLRVCTEGPVFESESVVWES